jgi:cytidylate kinase
MKILGISGTDGSGKDSLAEMLVERHGWQYISVTDILREEAKKRGMSLQRSILREISAEWRREKGLWVLVDKALEVYKKNQRKYKGLVMASLRNPGEADRLHELGGQLIWVDADPEIRYNRITSRKRGTEDEVTFEEFLAEEKAQSRHSGDEATLNLSAVKAKADIHLENNGNSIEAFKKEAEQALGLK